MKMLIKVALAAALLLQGPLAQAGIIEDLLALPAIQSLLVRVPELRTLVKRCEDAAYRQRNLQFCQQAEQAALLAKMPTELRAVMSRPEAAASLRDLCLAAFGKPAYESYLCAQLYTFDASFKQHSDQIRRQQFLDRQMR